MHHDKNMVEKHVTDLLAAMLAGDVSTFAEHTAGGAPTQRDTFADPAEVVDSLPIPDVEDCIGHLVGIGADTDRQAAAWCISAEFERILYNYCDADTPNTAVDDVAITLIDAKTRKAIT